MAENQSYPNQNQYEEEQRQQQALADRSEQANERDLPERPGTNTNNQYR